MGTNKKLEITSQKRYEYFSIIELTVVLTKYNEDFVQTLSWRSHLKGGATKCGFLGCKLPNTTHYGASNLKLNERGLNIRLPEKTVAMKVIKSLGICGLTQKIVTPFPVIPRVLLIIEVK